MVTTLTIDKAGRIVLPKPVREELQLSPGDSLEIDSSEERVILRPVRGNGRIYRKQGVWVMHAGAPLSQETVEKTIQQYAASGSGAFSGNESEVLLRHVGAGSCLC